MKTLRCTAPVGRVPRPLAPRHTAHTPRGAHEASCAELWLHLHLQPLRYRVDLRTRRSWRRTCLPPLGRRGRFPQERSGRGVLRAGCAARNLFRECEQHGADRVHLRVRRCDLSPAAGGQLASPRDQGRGGRGGERRGAGAARLGCRQRPASVAGRCRAGRGQTLASSGATLSAAPRSSRDAGATGSGGGERVARGEARCCSAWPSEELRRRGR